MKKSKFLKSVAALTLGAVAAAGAISLAACGHAHTTTHDWEKNSTQHWHVCDECEEEYDKENHNYTLENGTKCECGATKSSQGGVGGGSETPTAHAYTYSYTALTSAMGITDDGTDANHPNDQQVITQADFKDNNAFLTVTGSVKWRCLKKATGGAIEVKDGGLSVTFQGTGTITIGFGSTSGSNTSGLALVKADGTYLKATSTTATELAADETVADGYVNKAGLYTKAGGQKSTEGATVTYTITEAGTYTIYCNYCYLDAGEAKSRASRVWSIAMSDTY